MDSLIAELGKAEEGSRELDAKVAQELWPELFKNAVPDPERGAGHWMGERGLFYASHYTTNLQDALGLVPEGWCGDVEVGDCGQLEKRRAQLWNGEFAPDAKEVRGSAATPALALTLASIKARREA